MHDREIRRFWRHSKTIPIFCEWFQFFYEWFQFLRKIQLFCESFQYVVSYSIILWIIAIYCESFPYIVNFSNVWWIIPMYCEIFQYFVNNSNILWIHKMIELFIKYWNLSKVVRTPTIFKLIGPCEILSHGQKSEKRETEVWNTQK